MNKVTRAAAALICLTRLGMSSGFSQISVSGDLHAFISGQIEGLPAAGSGVYENPSANQLQLWSEALSLFYDDQLAEAHDQLAALDYRIIEFTDQESGDIHYIIGRTSSGSNHWGTYVYRANSCRKIVFQSPHPKYDTNTGEQGLYSYQALDGRSFFVSGTHRCNSGLASECSGTTTACGTSAAFKVSDMAHNSQSVFQLMTDLHQHQFEEDVFIQFHGFGKQSTDPNAILSNGTRNTPDHDYIDELLLAMKQANPSLEFKVGHQDISWDRLLAFTNTQGRLLNMSNDPCANSAEVASGKFIHIEQEKELFRSTQEGWDTWISPMAQVFECENMVLGSSDSQTSLAYPVPFQSEVAFVVPVEAESLVIFNVSGKLEMDLIPTDWQHVNLVSLWPGVYWYQIIDENKKVLSHGKLVKKM